MHKHRTFGAMAIALLAAAVLSAMAPAAVAQGTDFIMKGYDVPVTSEHDWKDAATIPPGAKMVLIYGDPKQEGPYIFRVKFPAGYKLPAHKHQDQRIVTVLQGNYWSAIGEQFEQAKLQKFTPGSFYVTEADAPHFSWAETEVIIQEQGMGPISSPIDYVDAAEDPRKK